MLTKVRAINPVGAVTWIAVAAVAALATMWIPQAAANPQVIDDVDPLMRDQILQELGLADFSLQRLDVLDSNEDRVQTQVELDGQAVTITLIRHSNRAPGFRVLIDNGTGELEEIDPQLPLTYRGTVQEWPGSAVAASIFEGQLSAMIYHDNNEWWIEPLSETMAGADPALHLFYHIEDVLPTDGVCGVEDGFGIVPAVEDVPNPDEGRVNNQGRSPRRDRLDPDADPSLREYDEDGDLTQSGDIRIAQIAYDADFRFFEINGNSTKKTRAEIENTLNFLNIIYARDAGVCHSITTVIIRTDREKDPYRDIPDAKELLCALTAQWNANHKKITRDTTHLMTGQDLNGFTIGIAFVRVICTRAKSCDGPENRIEYGLSQFIDSPRAKKVALTAHELGHNWSARHCNQSGDGCRGRSDDCRIMCSSIGGCSGKLTSFSPESAACITAHRDKRECLTTGCDCGRSFEVFSILVPETHGTIGEALKNASCGVTISIRTDTYEEIKLRHEFGGSVKLIARGGTVRIKRP